MMDYNSEISLLAGRCAGTTMANAGIGILRTLADLEPTAVSRFWAEAEHLGFTTHPASPGEFLRTLDANTSRGMAIMREAQKLLAAANTSTWEPIRPGHTRGSSPIMMVCEPE